MPDGRGVLQCFARLIKKQGLKDEDRGIRVVDLKFDLPGHESEIDRYGNCAELLECIIGFDEFRAVMEKNGYVVTLAYTDIPEGIGKRVDPVVEFFPSDLFRAADDCDAASVEP